MNKPQLCALLSHEDCRCDPAFVPSGDRSLCMGSKAAFKVDEFPHHDRGHSDPWAQALWWLGEPNIPTFTNVAEGQFVFTHSVFHDCCVISQWAVGSVLSSPQERALLGAWGCCYCFSSYSDCCGLALSPETHLLERWATGFRDAAVDALFLKINY